MALRVNEIVPDARRGLCMRRELGLDKPFFTRYFYGFLAGFQLDFGTSFDPKPGDTRDVNCSPHALLSGYRIIIYALSRCSLALWCVAKPHSLIGQKYSADCFVLTAIPNYWLGLLLI